MSNQGTMLAAETNPLALTTREIEVIRRAREGATDKEIADAIGITVASLRGLWNVVRDKLGAVNRTHAIALAAVDRPAATAADLRTRLVEGMMRERVATWVVRSRSRQAHLDGFGAGLFGLTADDGPIPLDRLLAHVWAPDRARFDRFLLQACELRAMTPIELRVGVPGDYRNLIRTINLCAEGGSEPTLLLASTTIHTFAS